MYTRQSRYSEMSGWPVANASSNRMPGTTRPSASVTEPRCIDAAAGSDLCLTLETFLGTGNAADGARTLFIHYNTMKHRMARITELLPGDLRDARFRLTVAFALQVRKLL